MKSVWRVAGILLLLVGMIWIVAVLGGVFSHANGFTNLNDLWGPIVFHTVSMSLGVFCFGQSVEARQSI